MRLRSFGRTGLMVSEVGFGAWGIGGEAYGAVDRAEALRALAVAEELGCNLVDTAGVYGASEEVIGEFFRGSPGRRARWLVATKFSNQPEGIDAVLDGQLARLGVDNVDFYQLHFVPERGERHLYEALARLVRAGKIRFAGVSLKNAPQIEEAMAEPVLDGFQVPVSLLDPEPFESQRSLVRAGAKGVLVRSSLREGFLTGKFHKGSVFDDPKDHRARIPKEKLAQLLDGVERFRFLEREVGALDLAAARYPLSFAETSCVLLGTKTAAQAKRNFGEVPRAALDEAVLGRIRAVQDAMRLRAGWVERARRAVRRTVRGVIGG